MKYQLKFKAFKEIHGLYCIGNFLIEGLGQGTVCFLYHKYKLAIIHIVGSGAAIHHVDELERKGSYFFYEQLLADNKENTNLSADLRNVAKLLKESGSYTGALDLNYREFARIYEFVNNVGDRHNHNCYLVMVTMNTLPEQLADIEEIEKALDCMEQSIRSKIRKVDVCTRYSSMQYLIILFEPQENQIPNVMERIFMHYYELCDREDFKPQYEYIKMTEAK